jgi:hypothetical protein
MILIEFHLGLRQVVMALMNWAIDVPQKLLQSDAKLFPKMNKKIHLFLNFIGKFKFGKLEELIIKES